MNRFLQSDIIIGSNRWYTVHFKEFLHSSFVEHERDLLASFRVDDAIVGIDGNNSLLHSFSEPRTIVSTSMLCTVAPNTTTIESARRFGLDRWRLRWLWWIHVGFQRQSEACNLFCKFNDC